MTVRSVKKYKIMPRTPAQFEEIRVEKRNIIKENALNLFAYKGFNPTSISEIARSSDISKGLIYNYFKSKDELLLEILMDFTSEFQSMIDPNDDEIISDEEASRFVDNYFRMLKEKQTQLKLFLHLTTQTEVKRVFKNQSFQDVLQKIESLILSYFSERSNDNSDYFKTNAIAVFRGFTTMYVTNPEKYPDTFLDGYKQYLKEKYLRF